MEWKQLTLATSLGEPVDVYCLTAASVGIGVRIELHLDDHLYYIQTYLPGELDQLDQFPKGFYDVNKAKKVAEKWVKKQTKIIKKAKYEQKFLDW